MSNFNFLKNYQRLQYGIIFDEITNLSFALVGYCKIDKSSFWNFALINKPLLEEEILKIEKKFKSLRRNPVIYFENRENLKSLHNFLKEKGYQKDFEDSWMFWQGKEIDVSHFTSVKKVITKEGLKVFLKTFSNCYQEGDPQNAYGELGDYLKVAKEVWHKHHKTNRIEYFLIYKGKNPVAVSTLTNHAGMGYISNMGSLKNVRGEGYGKIATLYCIEQSKKNGNNIHYLATEEGTYANKFYKRIGFNTLFTAVAYIKK